MDRWLDWFGSHSPYWLETLINTTGIHNYLSTVQFSPLEKLFLANGLRFICTPSRNRVASYSSQYTSDPTRGWSRFERTLTNRIIFSDNDRPDRVAKFTLPPRHTRDELTPERHQQHVSDIHILNLYTTRTLPLLQQALTDQHITTSLRQERMNCSQVDHTFMMRLIDDPSITCKPADKNLGLVLVDTSWYNSTLSTMLQSKQTYEKFNHTVTIGKHTQKCTLSHLPSLLHAELLQIFKVHYTTLARWHPDHIAQIERFVKEKVPKSRAVIPSIYLLIKVHKLSGLTGRPIVPCTHWITAPASILVDHLLQEILRKANLTHIVKDTKSFVNELEHTPMPCQSGVFVTADIASLYTNIDTKLGLTLIEQFLIEQQINKDRQQLILDLLFFVMTFSYLSFKGDVYHQIDGTAMGTMTAPVYANIVVYMLERPLLQEFQPGLYLYRRFLDDIFAYIEPDLVDRFTTRMNGLTPKLKFDFVSHPTEAAFLDLHIHKGRRFREYNLFDLRVHQKKMNLYLYIPFRSFHTDAAKSSFIQTELMRYIRNCSQQEYYNELKHVFYTRLRDRGYPPSFLRPIFNNIYYDDREYFLYPSVELHHHPKLITSPTQRPKSLCLIKRLARQQLQMDASRPPVFIIPYTPLSRTIPTRSLLIRNWPLLSTVQSIGSQQPIIAYQSHASLLMKLVHQKARRNEEERQRNSKPVAMIQQVLNFQPVARITSPSPNIHIEEIHDTTPSMMDISL